VVATAIVPLVVVLLVMMLQKKSVVARPVPILILYLQGKNIEQANVFTVALFVKNFY
jgi:hypothetical protein